MTLRHVVLDFDGTCTRVEDAADAYIAECLRIFEAEVHAGSARAFRAALESVRKASPRAGWTLAVTPAAPACADPYILVGEAIRIVVKKLGIKKPVPADLHARANDLAQAPWREEIVEVLEAFRKKKVAVHFVSNSKTTKIAHRLDDLLVGKPALRKSVSIIGDAGKFRIVELEADAKVSPALRNVFAQLPPASGMLVDGRPIYLRRGGYFEALCNVWGQKNYAAQTLVCGDIWELDLAMPAVLGAHLHLVKREAPYATYPYEKEAVDQLGPRASFGSLRDVLARL
jgi:hypothetical protein